MLKSEDKLVQEGVITPEEIGKIKKIIAERNVQNAKELLELAREEAKQRARRKAQKTIRNQKRRLVGNSIRSRQEVNRQLQNQTNKYPRSEN